MNAQFKIKKASRGAARWFFPVTKDPNDKSGHAIDSTELIHYLNKRITRAEIWECPLEKLGEILQLVGLVHQGIVVTMESGMLLVHKLPHEGEEGKGDAVVTYKSNMGENWSLVQGKDIQSAKLSDYLEKCGLEYNTVADNCLHAVARMWSLN